MNKGNCCKYQHLPGTRTSWTEKWRYRVSEWPVAPQGSTLSEYLTGPVVEEQDVRHTSFDKASLGDSLTSHLDYEAGEEQVGGGGDVDGCSIGIFSLILQSSEHHQPPPPRLHYKHRGLRSPLTAAHWPRGSVTGATELPWGETQELLSLRTWKRCACVSWGDTHWTSTRSVWL